MFPMVMRLKIRPADKGGVSLWIPVILIWIILWALMIFLFPLFLLAAVVTVGRGPGMRTLFLYPLLFAVLWNLSGLHVEMRNAKDEVLISFR